MMVYCKKTYIEVMGNPMFIEGNYYEEIGSLKVSDGGGGSITFGLTSSWCEYFLTAEEDRERKLKKLI